MNFGGLPPERAMMSAPQNGLVEGEEGGEMVTPGDEMEGYQYDQQGPSIDAEFQEVHSLMADQGDRYVFINFHRKVRKSINNNHR